MNSNANARHHLTNAKENNLMVGTYCRRDNQFKSRRFYFDLDTCEAYSYDWWQFVIKIGSTVYFNNASYSMQTSLHQEMAKNVLFQEGLQPFYSPKAKPLFNIKVVYVYYREGLNHLDNTIVNMNHEIKTLTEAIANPRSHKKTNVWRLKRISQIKKEIVKTTKFMKRVNKQIALNKKITSAKEDRIWEAEHRREELKRMRWQKEYLRDRAIEANYPQLIKDGAS